MKKPLLVLGFCLFALLVGASAQLLLGPVNMASGEIPQASRDFVFYQLRLPRLLIGFLIGSTLSLVGAAFQTLFQNPLATPSTLGTTAGAALGALLSLVLGLRGTALLPAATVFAFVGASAASFLVLSVATRRRARMEDILLAGIAVTLGTGAISQGLHAVADAGTLFAAAQWSLGQLPQVGYDRVLLLFLPALICAAAVLSQSRALVALSLGEEWARSVGVSTTRVRYIVLLASCLGVGASVALAGPIAFVGLLVPHLVRLGISGDRPSFLALSWFAGGSFLVVSDAIARLLLVDRELPVGVLTAGLGAPALFILVLRKRHPLSGP